MIKKVSILLLAAALLLTLIVCFLVKEPTIHCYYLRSDISSQLNTEGDAEFLYPGRSKGLALFQNEDAAPERTFSFQGTEYTVSYSFSAYAGPVTFYNDYYDNTASRISAAFSSRTGELTYVIYLRESADLSPVAVDQIPELEAVARQAAAENFGITDIGTYTLRACDNSQTEVWFYFAKYINGLPTSDEIRVSVYSDGTVMCITQFDVGMITEKHTKALKIFAEADIDALIANTVPEGSDLYVDEIKYLQYAVTPKGDVVIYATVTTGDTASSWQHYYADLIFALK